MTIITKSLNLKEPTLTYKSRKYPIVSEGLVKPWFVGIWTGSRMSGKTYSCVSLIRRYEETKVYNPITKKPMGIRTIIISPTFEANPVFTSLASLNKDVDVYPNYSDVVLDYIINDLRNENDNTKKYQEELEVWNRFINAPDPDKLNDMDLIVLNNMGFEPPVEPKYPNGCFTFLILDDLVGSAAYKHVGKSHFTNIVLKNRHIIDNGVGINVCMLTQSMKSIPKPIRVNTSLFVLFKYANISMVLKDVYEEVSGKISQSQFIEMFDFATSDPHSPLVMDFTGNSNEVFKKGFNELLVIQK